MTDTADQIVNFFKSARDSASEPWNRQVGLFEPLSVFSVARLKGHLSNPLLSPDWVQVMLNGAPVSLEPDYLWKFVQRRKLCFTDKTRLDDALKKGASLVLEAIDILDADINALITKIDQVMPCTLSTCEAFFSRKQNEAYGGHRDSDDVLVLQISGQKKWRVHSPQQRRYVGNSPLTEEQMGPCIAEFTMNPGDALYVRAGVPHRCTTVADHSLHLSIDLCDRTPNIEEITQMANQLHNHHLAPIYSSANEVLDHYINTHLKSEQLGQQLKKATDHMREQSQLFRKRMGMASAITALDPLIRNDQKR